MNRLTWTKEQRKEEGIGLLKYLSPEMCAKWDERLSTYEDADLLPAEITAMKAENSSLRAELEAAKRDIPRKCGTCAHEDESHTTKACYECWGINWQWRGVPANTPDAQEGEKQ